jgi:predicted nucleic acid-binding protein
VRGFRVLVSLNGGIHVPDIVIVDTDILVDVGRGVREAIACLEGIEQRLVMAISIITQMELIIGCRNKKELRSLKQFVSRFQLIKLNEEISDRAVSLLERYRLSHGLLIADALIAATSMSLNQPFITKNQSDYRFIEELPLLPYPEPFASEPMSE